MEEDEEQRGRDDDRLDQPAVGADRDKTYFSYYGMLMHQQNMLLDSVRTTAYYEAILGNAADFTDKIVLDIGAGTGILSFFAAKAGARRVYAVEASGMAKHARQLAKANGLDEVVKVVQGKIEEIELPERVDVIVSEPMGVLLVHERMMESFIVGRDRFLAPPAPGASFQPTQLFPSAGSIWLAPFSDIGLFADTVSKARFWENTNFHGIDLSALLPSAARSQFAQVIVGPVDAKCLLAAATSHRFDFATIKVRDLVDFTIKFAFVAECTGLLHGMAGWFDVEFAGSAVPRLLCTSPLSETTHWYQARFMLSQPIAVNRGQRLVGQMQLAANEQRSCDIQLTVHLEGTELIVQQEYNLQDQVYWNLSGGLNGSTSRESQGIYSELFEALAG